MEVKDAVKIAIRYVDDVFSSEHPKNIGLEEIKFDEMNKVWKVTVGFSRPWDYPQSNIVTGIQFKPPEREYKVVELNDTDGKVKAITIRN